MTSKVGPKSLNIRPGVSVLAALSHLQYTPWHALAEFVDNSLQSFLHHREALSAVGVRRAEVSISVDATDGRIEIRDNAGGIRAEDFPRAFRPAEIPPDATGLCEFGMGMKTAACWFAPLWTVKTSTLGDPVQRRVEFDVPVIVESGNEEVPVEERDDQAEDHYTVVTLKRVRNPPRSSTVAKIKSHLADIYRDFIREGDLELIYDGKPLAYESPTVLEAPAFDRNHDPVGDPVLWRREIDFQIGADRYVRGFAAIREKGDTKRAGFSLFRRRRLIEGSGDEKYKPHVIFKAPNSFESQRIFGEFHLEGFGVSHTKNGFQWDDLEGDFQSFLLDRLDAEEMPLITQAKRYRVAPKARDIGPDATRAANNTGDALEAGEEEILGIERDREAAAVHEHELPFEEEDQRAGTRTINLHHGDRHWRIVLEVSTQPSNAWYQIASDVLREDDAVVTNRLGVRLHVSHPFMKRLRKHDAETLEPFVRIAAGLALAETLARESGDSYAATMRSIFNELLAGPLSRNADDPRVEEA